MRRALLFLALILGLARPAQAEPLKWAVTLGGVSLGQITLRQGPNAVSLFTLVDRTPLGVFDGSFSAITRRDPRGGLSYVSASRTTRKNREISFVISQAGVVGQVAVTPADERTALSLAEKVPAGVVDPASAFARLAIADACPDGFHLYDGRRVVAVVPLGQSEAQGRLTCRLSYVIRQGPGHLSPLYLSDFKMVLVYAPAPDGRLVLDRLKLRGGIFTLRLRRMNGTS